MYARFHCGKHSLLIEEDVCPGGPQGYEVSWLSYLCRLFLIRRRCPYEIAFEENLALEEHPEKRTFSIFYFYAVTDGLLS